MCINENQPQSWSVIDSQSNIQITEYFRELPFGQGVIRGMVHIPLTTMVRGACVFIHGYGSSNRIGPTRLFVDISRILVQKGYYVWRFDSYGAGESDGELGNITYCDQFESIMVIIETILEETPGIDIMIAGHSMGASLGVRLAYHYKQVNKLLFFAPVLGNVSFAQKLFTSDQRQVLEETGELFRKGVLLKKSFIEMMESEDIFSICEQLQDCSTTLIYGIKDLIVSIESYKRMEMALKPEYIFKVEEGDHSFLAGDTRKEVLRILDDHLSTW